MVFSGRFRSAFLVFFVIFGRFENVLQVMGETNLDQDRRVNETRCPGIEGAIHTRLTGRDGGVAGRYKKLWHGRSPRIHIKFRASSEIPDAIRASRRFPHGGRGIEPFLRSA